MLVVWNQREVKILSGKVSVFRFILRFDAHYIKLCHAELCLRTKVINTCDAKRREILKLCFRKQSKTVNKMGSVRDCCQNFLPLWNKFKRINELLSLLKWSDNYRFSDDFGSNKSWLIHTNSFHNGSQFWKQYLRK